MAKVDFTVTSTANAYWLAVDNQDVPIVNHEGSLDVTWDKPTLIWWFKGDEGESVSIVGKVGGKTVVEIKKSVIPPKQTTGAGSRRFKI